MTVKRAATMLASLTIAASVAGVMVIAGAPTWAWLGIGFFVYLHSVAESTNRRLHER